MAVLLLVLGGVLALGLPNMSRRGRRRFWHSWIDNGMLPLAVGLAIGLLVRHLSWQTQADLRGPVQALLALAQASAGVLLGTQFRIAFLLRAGRPFMLGQNLRILLIVSVVLTVVLLILMPSGAPAGALAAMALVLVGLALAGSQRPLPSHYGDGIDNRHVIHQHVVPTGWWNLMAVIVAGLGLQIGLAPARPAPMALVPESVLELLPAWMIALILASVIGIGLGALTKGAKNSSEASLFLLAVLGLTAGSALIVGGAPLLTGVVVGAWFANLALGRLGLIERQLVDLEQPVVIGAGYLSGVLLMHPASNGLIADTVSALRLLVVVAVIGAVLLRWGLRCLVSPTAGGIARRSERALVAPGATGMLILASAVLAPSAIDPLLVPLACALLVLNLVAVVMESRLLAKARIVEDSSAGHRSL